MTIRREPGALPPPYAGQLIDLVDRLRAAGFEPTAVVIPSRPPTSADVASDARFYGLPVRWAPSVDTVQVVLDVTPVAAGSAVWWQSLTWTCHACGEERPDAKISVASASFSLADGRAEGAVNLRYCNDRPTCKTYIAATAIKEARRLGGSQ